MLCLQSLFSSLFFFNHTLLSFLSLYFIASSVSLSPSWIIALLTCFVQSTQTYFPWCLPAAWLSLAHPSSSMAPVFLLTTAEPSGARFKQSDAPPALSRHFLGHLSSVHPPRPQHPPAPCPSPALPAWFRRSCEGSEWPGAQVGAILRIFIISFKSSLCSGE